MTSQAAAYANGMRRRGGTWIFQHIPKTAGTSLVHELRACFPPYRNIHVARDDYGKANHSDALMRAVDGFLQDHAHVHFASASGHLRLNHLQRILDALPHARVFTFVREPAARLISEFRYTRTAKHPNYKEYLERYASIGDFARCEAQQDKMWRFLAPAGIEPDSEGLASVFRRLAFIGTVEEMELCFEFFSGLSGCPRTPTARANVTASEPSNVVTEAPEIVREIRMLNPKDVALYEAVSAALAERREEMRAEVSARRAFYLEGGSDPAFVGL